jgi:hypothetical protein
MVESCWTRDELEGSFLVDISSPGRFSASGLWAHYLKVNGFLVNRFGVIPRIFVGRLWSPMTFKSMGFGLVLSYAGEGTPSVD